MYAWCRLSCSTIANLSETVKVLVAVVKIAKVKMDEIKNIVGSTEI